LIKNLEFLYICTARGKKWIAAWEAAKHPWFNFTSGNGFYSTDKYWIEHLDIPFGYIKDYIKRIKKGDTIERPMAAIAAERERITEEYTDAIGSDEAKAAFQGKLGLARVVFRSHNVFLFQKNKKRTCSAQVF
jgi:pyruvate, water dikinase